MQQVTPILDNESAIQYQGVKDSSSRTGTYPVVGLMIGTFKRGRFDKPMTVTNGNIRAQLGYDPKNPSYIAVQDVLASGVPSVQVLRVKGGGALVCQTQVFSGRYYAIYPDGIVDMPDSEMQRLAQSIYDSLEVTIEGAKYIPTNVNGDPVTKSLSLSENRISMRVDASGNSLSFEVCAAVPFRIEIEYT